MDKIERCKEQYILELIGDDYMGKVYMKTRFDKEMNMDIPHSINIAAAMYGFRDMGAEIIPYHSLDDIYDMVKRDDIVLDYIHQCNEVFHKFNVTPVEEDYPDVLKPFLGRKIWTDTIENFSRDEEKWKKGYFVKPLKSKAFTGKIIDSISSLVGCGNQEDNYEILVSEPMNVKAEWRCFILYDEIIDVRPYGVLIDSSRKSYKYSYDSEVLQKMMEAFVTWDERPAACSMDICVTDDKRTLLVECNDAYALGEYGLAGIYYAKMISARWSQLLSVEDEYRF